MSGFDSAAPLRKVLADEALIGRAFNGLDLTVGSAMAKVIEGYQFPEILSYIKSMRLSPLEDFSNTIGALALDRRIRVGDLFKLAIPDLTLRFQEIPRLSAALAVQISVASFMVPPVYERLVRGPLLTGLRDLATVELTDPDVPSASFAVVGASGALGATTTRPPVEDTEPEGGTASVDTTIALVRGFDVELAVRLEGGFFALRSGSPDAVSQAAHSLQEAMDRTLRAAAPSDLAEAWCHANHPAGLASNGQVTRAGRVRYLAHAAGVTPDAAEPIILLLKACTSLCQKAKHDDIDALTVHHYAPLVQGVVGAFVSMAIAASERQD